MKYLVWYGAGLLTIGIPFIAFYDPYSLWGSVIAGSVGASLYLIALYWYFMKQEITRKEQFVAGLVCVLLIAGYALETWKHYAITHYQRETLGTIRVYIGSQVIIFDKIYGSMLPVLNTYHNQTGKKKPIVKTFREMYGTSIDDGTFNKYPPVQDYVPMGPVTFLSFQGDSVIHYVCVDTIAKGMDPHFKNASGQTGKLQFLSTLTSRGVHYERIN